MKKEPRGCGGYAWWCYTNCRPVKVYVYGMHPVSEDTLYTIQVDGQEHEARESSLFDTEEEALEEALKRIDKTIKDTQAALDMLTRHRAEYVHRLNVLQEEQPLKSGSTVTTSAVISGSGTTRADISVVGKGRLEIKDGAIVKRLTIKDGGSCSVYNAWIEDVHVYSSAYLSLSGSSMMYKAQVDAKSEIWVDGSSEVSTITIGNAGSAFVRHKGTAKFTKVANGGILSVKGSGASAIQTTVKSGGTLYVSEDAYIANCIVEPKGIISKTSPYTIENLNVKSGGIDK